MNLENMRSEFVVEGQVASVVRKTYPAKDNQPEKTLYWVSIARMGESPFLQITREQASEFVEKSFVRITGTVQWMRNGQRFTVGKIEILK
jgi:hypothetical protein